METTTFKAWAKRSGRAPSVHFALLGALLFLGSPLLSRTEKAEKPRLRVTAAREAEAERKFAAEAGRPPSTVERSALRERLIDEEILFAYALSIGLHHAEVPTRRLASIAAFVESPGQESPATVELAKRAVELGLHQGDFVTRRVLVDAASRLIRAAPRLVEPSDEELERYLAVHGERFRGDDEIRISHLLLSASRRKHPEADAAALLVRLRRENAVAEGAAGLGDSGPVPPRLPLLSGRALERRFGKDFAEGLIKLPEGTWSGPVPSRYGAHLVFVHARRPGHVPGLAEAREQVLAAWHEEAAERWLSERLRQLREDYEVVLESEVTS